MADPTVQGTIEELAIDGFASTSASAGSISQSAMPVESLIAADRYLKGEKAKKKRWKGIGILQVQPPGSIQ